MSFTIFSLLTELLNLILEYCDISLQLKFLSTNKYIQSNLYITSLFDDENQILTNDILKQYKFRKLKNLAMAFSPKVNQDGIKDLNLSSFGITNNCDVTNVSHMKKLQSLAIIGGKIDQKGIVGLDLIEFICSTPRITNVTWMKNLLKLNAAFDCGINQEGISGLNLTDLDVSHNSKIFDVSFMSNLTKLMACSHNKVPSCGIDQNGIRNLNLTILYVINNSKVHDVSFMKNLKVLHAQGFRCGINQNGIRNLNLEELSSDENPKIRDVSFMKNLKKLYICDVSNGIGQSGIKGLNLLELNVRNNPNVYDVSFMNNLRTLEVSNNCGVDQKGIQNLNLVVLYANSNPKIYDVSFMSNLRELYAYGICGINKNGVRGLKLTVLDAENNLKLGDSFGTDSIPTYQYPINTMI